MEPWNSAAGTVRTPRQTVEDYLVQVGLRGWGTFSLDRLEAECVEIGIQGSALAP